MKSSQFIAVIALCAVTLWGAVAPKDGLLLYASFEKGLSADIAGGEKTPVKSAGAEIVPEGKYGKGFIQKKSGSLTFAAKGNINPAEGTIAMWVKPVNWRGDELKFRFFCSVGGVQKQGYASMQLYRYSRTPYVMLLVRKPGISGSVQVYDTHYMSSWKPGEWHHLAFSWSKSAQQCVIYCDGQPTKGPYKAEFFPETIDQLIQGLSFNALPGNTKDCDPTQLTVMDEIYVYDHAIGDGGIQQVMKAGATEVSAAPKFTMPYIHRAPALDGRITDGEYAEFFSTNTLVEYGRMGFYPRESRVFAGYDDKNLYFCFKTRTKGGDANIEIQSRYQKRDDTVWLDDAVEMLIMPPNGAFTQIVANSISTIFDSQRGDMKFNGKYEIANLIEGYWWICEIKIPFAELGIAAPKQGDVWRMNLARDWKNPFNFASLTDTLSFQNVDEMPEWTFGDDKGSVSARLDIEAIQSQQVHFSGTYSGQADGARASLYALQNDGQRQELASATISAKNADRAFELAFSGENISQAKYQNKIGFCIQRKDGAVLQDSAYILRTYPPMTLLSSLLNSTKEFLCTIDISGLPVALKDVQLELCFKENGKTTKEKKIPVCASRILYERYTPTQWSPDRKCTLTVRAIDSKTKAVVLEKELSFTVPVRESWQDCTAGTDHTVPIPWTPVVRHKNTIQVWNRTYSLQENGLPAQITSGGVEMLSEPMRLSLRDASGRLIPFQGLTFDSRSYPDEVTFSAAAKTADFRAELKGRIEFDGFCWYDLQIIPLKEGASVGELSLEFCLPEKEVKFIQSCPFGTGYADLLKPVQKKIGFPYIRQLLFGNDDRSLAWFTESDQYYRPEEHPEPIHTWEDKGIRHARIALVASTAALDTTFTYGFGFNATPLKPIAADWQNMITNYRGKYNKESRIIHIWSWSRWYGFMRPVSEKDFRLNLGQMKAYYHQATLQPYLCQYILSMLSPEYKLYSEEWSQAPRCEIMEFGPRYPGKSVVACIGPDSYRNFWVDSFDHFLDDYPEISGCYWDSIDPVACENALHGHGWTDAKGKRHPTNDILHYRDFYKRCYKIMKAKRPQSLITGHSSQRRNLPTISFCDIVYDGEQFVSNVSGDPDYCRWLSDLYCRAFFGTQFGLVPLFMPAYYNNEKMAMTTRPPTESIYLHALVYNFIVHSHRINNQVTDEILDITRPFNLAQAEYIAPYSANLSKAISVVKNPAGCDIRCAAYVKPDGRKIVIVGNFSQKSATVGVRITGNGTVRDRRKNAVVPENGGEYTLTIPGSNFVILER